MWLLTNKYAIGAILFICSLIASGWLSYDYGVTKVELQWSEERVALDKATTAALVSANEKNRELTKQLDALNIIIENKDVAVRIEQVEVEKEVIKYVEKYISGTCPVDGERLRIKNRAIASTNEFAQPTKSPAM